jgi:hypothetical protein
MDNLLCFKFTEKLHPEKYKQLSYFLHLHSLIVSNNYGKKGGQDTGRIILLKGKKKVYGMLGMFVIFILVMSLQLNIIITLYTMEDKTVFLFHSQLQLLTNRICVYNTVRKTA